MKVFLILALITLISFAVSIALTCAYGNVGIALSVPTIILTYWAFHFNQLVQLRKGVIIND